jgi:hypothetical protein
MRRLLTIVVVALLVTLAAPAAHALPPWMQNGKTGRFMFNLKLGPSIGVDNVITQFAIVPEMGIAVDRDFNAYIILPLPAFQVAFDQSIIQVPIGFQYDIAIKAVPGLYISPAVTTGFAAIIYDYNNNTCPTCQTGTIPAGFFQPEVGGKLIFNRRFNVGFVPFSLPIYFGNTQHGIVTPNGTLVNGGSFAFVSYRILVYGGINF